MGKRKDHHKQIISEVDFVPDMLVTQFHTAQKMPRTLRGVPDLNLQREGFNFWVEIKPKYANYMRDQMSNLQWQWFHERYTKFAFDFHNRYAIVTDSVELDWFIYKNLSDVDPFVWMPDYHWSRYEAWRRGR
jgi:hypothetical protein